MMQNTITPATLGALLLAMPWWALAQASVLPQQRDAAGNVMEPLGQVLRKDENGQQRLFHCTADRDWCLSVEPSPGEGDWARAIEVIEKRPGADEPSSYRAVMDVPEDGELSLWPWIIRLAPGVGTDPAVADPQQRARQSVLMGGIVATRTSYSGGGASASVLQLARVRHLDEGIQVDNNLLTVPWEGNAMIRACFSEQDMKQRSGACHDTYAFSAKLGLDTAAAGMPALRYQTVATRFPAGVSRQEDSLAKGPLKKKDLRTEQDPACTFARTFRIASGSYLPDQPLPDCSGYTEL